MLTPAGQTARRGGLKFAHRRDDFTGMRLCRVCGRRGAGVARGTRWKKRQFPRCLNMGNFALETGGNGEMRPTRVCPRANISRTERWIDTGSTRTCRQSKGLANRMPVRGWSGARAFVGHLRCENCRFVTISRQSLMQITIWQLSSGNSLNFPGKCTDSYDKWT